LNAGRDKIEFIVSLLTIKPYSHEDSTNPIHHILFVSNQRNLRTSGKTPAYANVLSVDGKVIKSSASGCRSQLKVGDTIVEGDRINSSKNSRADLVFSNGSKITINEGSFVKMKKLKLEAGTRILTTIISLNYGQVRGNVKKLSNKSLFQITTSMGTASLQGSCETVVKFNYEKVTKEFQLSIRNVKGSCDFIGQGNANYYAIDNINGDPEEVKNEFNGEALTEPTTLPEETALVVTCGQENPVRNAIIVGLTTIPGVDIVTTTDGNVAVAVDTPVINNQGGRLHPRS